MRTQNSKLTAFISRDIAGHQICFEVVLIKPQGVCGSGYKAYNNTAPKQTKWRGWWVNTNDILY